MDWGLILSFAYSLVPIISVIGYGPQIMSVLKHEGKLENFPFSTWSIWMLTSVVSLAYGVFKLNDVLFIITALSCVIPNMLVIAAAVYKAQIFSRRSALKVNAGIHNYVNEIANQVHDERNQREYVQSSEHNWIITVDHALIPEQPQTIQ